eukprot:scaffold123736_cov60-Phaeocystis_antarctica.AAC.2
MAPRPRAAASAEAPASPTGWTSLRKIMAGSAPTPSPSTSRCTPPAPAADLSPRIRCLTRSAAPSSPSNARSEAERSVFFNSISFAFRSSLQLHIPILPHRTPAASWSAFSCCSSACVGARSP